ncbi:unnamed protein product [Lupinus luteus]|uniref:Uncharacterized protein n=1 Tax=Lupinus luteus TaxID=3873 RepID=A0AAV1VZG4_LUPLU
MGFAGKVAKEFGIPELQFWTASVCGFQGYLQYDEFVRRDILPFKDENFSTDGTLDTSLEWISGIKDMRIKDIPSFIRVTNLDDIMFNFLDFEAQNCLKSSLIIINTLQDLEIEILQVLMSKNPNIYPIGPLHLLDQWEPSSVIYVNYGSITVMTKDHLNEFAWGLANSNLPFLWIMRSDLVRNEEYIGLAQEFLDEVKDRGYITSWCIQEQVLAHPSIGVFLTHYGWNSIIEAISEGVPMTGWHFFAEQQTNCRYISKTWGIAEDINEDVKREEVTKLVKDMVKGEIGKEIRQNCLEWKKKVIEATDKGDPSYNNFYRLINEALDYHAA